MQVLSASVKSRMDADEAIAAKVSMEPSLVLTRSLNRLSRILSDSVNPVNLGSLPLQLLQVVKIDGALPFS